MSVGTEGAFELIRRYRTKWRLNVEGTLPANLKERGVDSPKVVSDYPFRDDALLTYNAILQYVTEYVLLYYPSDDVLSKDREIQEWRAELDIPIENGGLGVLGVEGVDGKFTSRDQLIQVVASIIYTCSAGHAGVNFKQYDEYAFPMNYPSKLRGKPPSDKRSHSERDVLKAIQDRSDQYRLLTIVKILSEHSFGKPLGNFEIDYVCEQKALDIVEKFREELKKVHETIQERNNKRPIRYDYMDPILIPNSISI
ncbi:allene oxide synthase-lipoxygenase protein-like [Dreissena polymorpha]|nr:allene oxide synthase-lipoxygenase protein-like [Dreissena polymorpha]